MTGKRPQALYCSDRCRLDAQIERRRQRIRQARPSTGHKKLGKGHLRILAFLHEKRGPFLRRGIAGGTKMDKGQITKCLGQVNPEKRAAYEAKTGIPSLLSLGYVRQIKNKDEIYNEWVYVITPAGRAALGHTSPIVS